MLPDLSDHGYLVERELGAHPDGGRATFLATSLDRERRVVVKRFSLASRDASWEGLEGMQREVALLRELDHPAIPRYVESFTEADGLCLVQQYVDAPSLAERTSFEPEELRRIALDVLAILAYLQRRVPPVVHRDLKPQNLLLDAQGKVWLVDFGIARVGARGDSTIAVGTPGFMPPEQALGRALGPSVDVYGLGATLYALACGLRTRDVAQHVDNAFSFDLALLPSSLGAPFRAWLQRMLAVRLEDRFADANQAAAALRSITIGAGELATPGEESERRRAALPESAPVGATSAPLEGRDRQPSSAVEAPVLGNAPGHQARLAWSANTDEAIEALTTHLERHLLAEHRYRVRNDGTSFTRLREAVAKAVAELRTQPETQLNLPFLGATGEGPVHLDVEVSREQVDRFVRLGFAHPPRAPAQGRTALILVGLVAAVIVGAVVSLQPESDDGTTAGATATPPAVESGSLECSSGRRVLDKQNFPSGIRVGGTCELQLNDCTLWKVEATAGKLVIVGGTLFEGLTSDGAEIELRDVTSYDTLDFERGSAILERASVHASETALHAVDTELRIADSTLSGGPVALDLQGGVVRTVAIRGGTLRAAIAARVRGPVSLSLDGVERSGELVEVEGASIQELKPAVETPPPNPAKDYAAGFCKGVLACLQEAGLQGQLDAVLSAELDEQGRARTVHLSDGVPEHAGARACLRAKLEAYTSPGGVEAGLGTVSCTLLGQYGPSFQAMHYDWRFAPATAPAPEPTDD